MKRQFFKTLLCIVLFVAFIAGSFIAFFVYKINLKDESTKNIAMEVIVQHCNCSLGKIHDKNASLWKICLDSSNVKTNVYEYEFDDYKHIHDIVEINANTVAFIARLDDGKDYLIKQDNGIVEIVVSLDKLPDEILSYANNVLLLYESYTDKSSALYEMDLTNGSLNLIADDVEAKPCNDKVYTRGSKIIYRVDGKEGNLWAVYDNGRKFLFQNDGLCLGFNSEFSVVFYNHITSFFLKKDYELGCFVEYDYEKKSSSFMSVTVSPASVTGNFSISGDSNYALMTVAGKLGFYTGIVNLENGAISEIGSTLLGNNYKIKNTNQSADGSLQSGDGVSVPIRGRFCD